MESIKKLSADVDNIKDIIEEANEARNFNEVETDTKIDKLVTGVTNNSTQLSAVSGLLKEALKVC